MLSKLSLLSNSETRSISAENPNGEKSGGAKSLEGTNASCAKDLGMGWKISPSINIEPLSTATIAQIEGPGVIQHIWNTVHPSWWRRLILRVYWDDEPEPSIEIPLGDFFCSGWCERVNINGLPICVNPAGGFNSYWEMPFRKSVRITIENIHTEVCKGYYYQITYGLQDVEPNAAYLHAQFRRSNPIKYKEVHTLLENVSGHGHYVGTYLAWQVNNNGWWGEGEIKFYMDGDKEFPTICGTGTEDYFGGAWNFEHPSGQYGEYSTPFMGMYSVYKPDGLYKANQRFGMYRWHALDPIRFKENLRVTIQALGWRAGGKYLPLQDDIASTAYWYQTEPHASFPKLPDKDALEVI